MKKKLFSLLLAVAASIGTMFAWDYERVQIGDLYYNLNATNKTAEVTSQNSDYLYWSTTITTANIPTSVTYNSATYSVTSIGNHAFHDCSSLTSVTIPNSVTSIGEYAFFYCSSLTSITIPNSVTSIGNDAFRGCSSLTSVTIPNSVTSIGGSAFHNCKSLTSVTITDLAAWCNIDFENNSANPLCYAHKLYLNGELVKDLVIPNSVTSIGSYAFWNCTSLTSVTIPNSVTSIGGLVFYNCSSLTSPVYNAHCFAYMPTSYSGAYAIPEGIKQIAGGAFAYCSSLTSITIPNSVTSIGNDAFRDCSSLTSVTIPNSVTSIGDDAFYNCKSLTSPVYNAHCFAYMPPSYSGAYAIPEGIKQIAGGAFSGCSSLTSITIPNSVTSIGEYAFFYCSSLTSITIPNSVTSIGFRAFADCSKLTSVTIPNSVTSIGGYAFCDCSSLTSVTIPNSVTSIGDHAFYKCSSLISITCKATTPPTVGSSAFYGVSKSIPVYVPCGCVEAYKAAYGWKDFTNIQGPLAEYSITVGVNATQMGTAKVDINNACGAQISAKPNIGYHFVQWNDGNTDNPRIAQITQDTTFTAEFAYDRVGTCGKDLALVWSYDPNSKVLTIGNAGEFTENMRFGVEAPNEMEELVIGNNITAIGENAFAGISTLKKVTIGESVKTIHNNAFYNCVNLETIFNYRPTPTNAYSTAFDGVDKFACSLYVLPSSIDMYKNASVWRDFYYTYAIGAEEATVTTNNVTVEPQDNAATLTWPTSENAATYTIEITKDGEVFCTLIFNANGQLTGIAFAPSRDGQAHAPAAIMTANGLQFTVTGLNSNTQYGYNLTAKDANDQTVATYSGSFTTTSEGIATGVEEVSSSLQGGDRGRLILRDGQVLILRNGKTYTMQGQEVK